MTIYILPHRLALFKCLLCIMQCFDLWSGRFRKRKMCVNISEYQNKYACVAQLVVQLIRNEQVAGSSPVTSSKEQSPSNRYNTWFEGLCIFYICLYALLKAGLFCSLFCKHGCQKFLLPVKSEKFLSICRWDHTLYLYSSYQAKSSPNICSSAFVMLF